MGQHKYLDLLGLETYHSKLQGEFGTKLEIDKLIQKKRLSEWLAIGDEVLEAGTILVYTDRTSVDGELVPDIKVADGTTSVNNLPFLVERDFESIIKEYNRIVDDTQNEIYLLGAGQDSDAVKRNTSIKMKNDVLTASLFDGMASASKRVEHTLTIGTYSFDGSQDVVIPIYDGSIQ